MNDTVRDCDLAPLRESGQLAGILGLTEDG
jgi:hypothetical protein